MIWCRVVDSCRPFYHVIRVPRCCLQRLHLKLWSKTFRILGELRSLPNSIIKSVLPFELNSNNFVTLIRECNVCLNWSIARIRLSVYNVLVIVLVFAVSQYDISLSLSTVAVAFCVPDFVIWRINITLDSPKQRIQVQLADRAKPTLLIPSPCTWQHTAPASSREGRPEWGEKAELEGKRDNKSSGYLSLQSDLAAIDLWVPVAHGQQHVDRLTFFSKLINKLYIHAFRTAGFLGEWQHNSLIPVVTL